MPFVIDPPQAPPLPPPADDGSFVWEEMYDAMGFHRERDAEFGYPLRIFCEGWCKPLQAVYDIVRDRGDRPGWAILFDPDECPAESLPYLAQFVGARLVPEMTEAQQRAEIKEPSTWRRGTTEAFKTTLRRTLTGTQRVIVRERTPEPWDMYVRVLASECAEPTRTERLAKEFKVGGLVLDFAVLEGVTVDDVAAGWETVDELAEAFSSVEDLAAILPDELPEP